MDLFFNTSIIINETLITQSNVENFEQKYKEALERARELASKCLTNRDKRTMIYRLEDIETIFPELKESEDESIRKEIIQYLKDYVESLPYRIEDCEVEVEKVLKYIAWLEKQSSLTTPKFRVGDTIKCKFNDRVFTIKSVDVNKGTYTYVEPNCGNNIDYADECFELVEQKPTEALSKNNAWIKCIIKDYERLLETDKEHYATIEAKIQVLESILRYKPMEWTEEDEQRLISCIAILDFLTATINIKWLKSLKQRILNK